MDLSTLYPKTAASQDLEKNAEAELFCKLAAQNGIDLTKMNDDEVSALYNYTFNKVAEDESDEKKDEAKKDDDKEDEEKKEAAAVEHAQKLAFAKEAQQADELGRRMAHSYVDELNKIGSALQAQAAAEVTQTGAVEGEVKEAGMPPALAKALGKVGDKVKNAPEIIGGKVRKLVGDMPAGKAARQATGERSKTVGKAIIGGAAAVGAGAAGAKAFGKKKESSALDQLALEAAVKIAHDSGFDPEEAADRVTAVNTLGLQESTKVASTLDQQVEVRALEFLEAAGYPVEWAQ